MKISNLLTGASLALIAFIAMQTAQAQSTATTPTPATNPPASLGANQPVMSGSLGANPSPPQVALGANQAQPAASLGANVSNTNTVGTANSSSNANSGYVANNPNWSVENAYWQQNFSSRPYYQVGANYNTYQPAYQYGVNAYSQYNGQPYSAVQTQLQNNWNSARGNSNLTWAQAQKATQDAYERIYNIQHNLNPGVTVSGTGAVIPGTPASTNGVNSTTSNANTNIGTRGNVGTGTTASGTNFGISTATVNGVPAAAPPTAPIPPNAPIAPAASTVPAATSPPAASAGVAATGGHK